MVINLHIFSRIDEITRERQRKSRTQWLLAFSRRFFIIMYGYGVPMDLSCFMGVAFACYEVDPDKDPVEAANDEAEYWDGE